MRPTYESGKRVLDVVGALALLVVTLPLQAVTALLIRLHLGKAVLFRQLRPGRHGEPFRMVKFRTMHHVDPARGLIDDESRLTPLGQALRATSLDELPTLWNVVRGDMSLVGPRPLLMQYLERYSKEQVRRHEVRPGLTGLAQVSGRNALDWDDKLRLDVEYVDRRSFWFDLRILIATGWVVVRRRGISAKGEATMPEFLGRSVGGGTT